MIKYINRWYDRVKPFLFRYKDGFFELPYVSNTPILMIDSFRKMPFIKHDELKKRIISNSPFVDANVYYFELSEELIVVYSTLIIKSNTCFKSHLNKSIDNDWYNLTLSTNLDFLNVSKRIIKGEQLEKSTFQFLKQGYNVDTYHFKDSNFISFSIYFKKSFIDRYLRASKTDNKIIKDFITSNRNYVISSISDENYVTEFLTNIKEYSDIEFKYRDQKLMIKYVNDLLDFYTSNRSETLNMNKLINISNNDRIKIVEIEKILQSNIYNKFPGITILAKQVGFSETKLKSLFKLTYGATLLDYFQNIQMKRALEKIHESNNKVTDIASEFGYSNVSKFSSTFKKYNGKLPSDFISNKL